jgi:two-component system, LytTR family, response regulator
MQEQLRTLLVDDERLARAELRSMLASHPEITVTGEADRVRAAVQAIRTSKPDVVFLDIQMPGESGFELLEQVEVPLKVIFVTAFDKHALRAFEVNAVDYLMKPVHPQRLARAIERVRKPETERSGSLRKLSYEDRVFLTSSGRARFLPVSQVVCAMGADDYAELVTADGHKVLSSRTLKDWEARLPERQFVRVHRSAIINLEYVETVEVTDSGSYQVRMRSFPTPISISRRYAAMLKERFS